MKNTSSKTYYTLLILREGKWMPEFGDYALKTVDEERDCLSDDCKMKDMKIIATLDDQFSIDAKVAELNAEAVKEHRPKGEPLMKKPKPYKLKKSRHGIYYVVDKITKKMKSLKTEDKDEVDELAKAEYNVTDCTNAQHHLKVAEANLMHCNPEWLTTTWDMIAKRIIDGPRGKYGGEKKASTKYKEECSWRNPCWDELRHKRAIDTVPRDFEKATRVSGLDWWCSDRGFTTTP